MPGNTTVQNMKNFDACLPAKIEIPRQKQLKNLTLVISCVG